MNTAARTARLRRLGIDVWTRRRPRLETSPEETSPEAVPEPPRQPSAPLSAPRPAGERRAAKSKPRPVAPPVPAAPAESFRIHCHRRGTVFLAIGEDALPRRRFLLDVAAAASGLAAADERPLVFEWPQPGAAADAHERAFRAFFLRQMQRCTHAVLAGARPATLLGHAPPETSGPLGSHFHIAGQPLDGAGKKRLWQDLCEWLGQP